MQQIIKDQYFRVHIDIAGSSPAPEEAIWRAQHTCVAEGFAPSTPIPKDPGLAIIKNELVKGHWSVLKFASVVLHFNGFPHDAVMQMVRHQGSSPLVQSMRYTGDRFSDCGNGKVLAEDLFYSQPPGIYASRNGTYTITESDWREDMAEYQLSAAAYSRAIAKGRPEESARRLLAAGYRQNFCMAGTIRDVFHWLDQRTLTDSQIECQTLAWMALDVLEVWCPVLFGWYRENRAGKNKLAP
jgi:flavin-dependent thymidylate synthase